MKKLLFVLTLLLGLSVGKAHAQDFKIENGALVVNYPILFETGSAVLKPESDSALNYIKHYLDEKTYITLMRIEGHYSFSDETTNRKLSQERAMSVCRWLVGKGISCTRLIAVGFGSSKPNVDNSTPDGKMQNSRIECKNAALRGRPIGGMPVEGGGEVAGDVCK